MGKEKMRNSNRKKVTLKTKFPPALSHHFLLDQQKKKIHMQKTELRKIEKANKQITQQKCPRSSDMFRFPSKTD